MELVFNLVLHALLIGSLALFVGAIAVSSLGDPDPRERVLRVAALTAGAMIALGVQAAGVDYARFTVDALTGGGPASAVARVEAAAVPGLLGVGLGFYIVRVFRRADAVATRVLGFVAILAGTAFAAIYARAIQVEGVSLGASAVPNVAFMSGMILTIAFTDPRNSGASGRGGTDPAGPAGPTVVDRFLRRERGDVQAPDGKREVADVVIRRPGGRRRQDPFSR